MPSELTNEFGVFVTTNATAGGDGTKEHPLATISAAIERVKDLKLRVYVCAGTYAESLTLVNAVSVIGSLSCDGGMWTTGGGRSIVNAPTSPAVRAKDITLTTRFEGFDVNAPKGSAAAPNSIALIAENATTLTVVSTKLTSAKAFDGADGTESVQLTDGTALTGKKGADFSSAFADPRTGPQSQAGGAGGIGSCVGAPGHDGESGKLGGSGAVEICSSFIEPLGGNSWRWQLYARNGVFLAPTAGAPGTGGAGAPGADGVSASTNGAFTPAGYSPLDGTAGADGAPGFGGKGGDAAPTNGAVCGTAGPNGSAPATAGTIRYDASGAGGGAGGCPGLAGKPGSGGGASIAALVFSSPGLSLATCELVAGQGGNGGKGAFPSGPTVGGDPGGAPTGTRLAAAGGAGGRAGFSGNGAGGPSVALAHTGGEITVAPDTHTTAGVEGAAVPARSSVIGGVSVTIPASAAGVSMPVLAF
jgi:hypothetical protein